MKKLFILLLSMSYMSVMAATIAPPPAPGLDPHETEAVALTPTTKLIAKTIADDSTELHYTISATYPVITGEKLSPAEKNFNRLVEQKVNAQIDQFKKYVTADKVHMQTLPESVRQNSLTMDYDFNVIKPNKHTIINLRLSIEGMQAGRAHPYHKYQVMTFDLDQNKELALQDIFKPGFLKVISAYSNKKLGEKLQDKWMIQQGTAPKIENFKNWNLQADSLLITFDEYQVAPYVNGASEVEIPYAELSKEFTTNSPVVPCVKSASNCEVG